MSAPGQTSAPPLSRSLGTLLSAMMFFQYAIWGAWLPLLWPFLSEHRQFTPGEIGNIFGVSAVGAIVAPFVAGQIADRWFNTEKFLALSHIVGAGLAWQLAELESYAAFLWISVVYSIIYSPTISLTNSLAFHHLPDRDRDFSRVRVWGTVGWIVAGIGVGQWLLAVHTPDCALVEAGACTQETVRAAQVAGMADAFRLSAVMGLFTGIGCFFLPATPPSKQTQNNATLDAIRSIKKRPLLVLFLLAVPISCVHQFYFVHTAGFLGHFEFGEAELINRIFGVGGGGLMTVGQMSEIAVLAAVPVFATRWSRKTLLGIGIVAYALRMLAFMYADATSWSFLVILFGLSMHGFAFGCFIFVGFMIVDEEVSIGIRASAQSLFNLVTIGVGIIVGSKLAAAVADWATRDGKMDYDALFSVPLWMSVGCLVALLVFYPGGSKREA